MNWKFEAIDKLKSYELKKEALRTIPEEIKDLEEQFCSIRGALSDSEPVKGSAGSRREDVLLNNITKRDELEKARQLAERTVHRIDSALSALTEEEQIVLRRFYIEPEMGNVERLCSELGIEKATVYRRRNDALRRFTMAMYGCCET